MRWEYKTLALDTTRTWTNKTVFDEREFNAQLQALGDDEWELVSVSDINAYDGETATVIAIFKRPQALQPKR